MSSSTTPFISVVLPVFNCELYLEEAIDSILAQSFSDFELIILNDGSTDRSLDIARSYCDSRIRVICNSERSGIVDSLNRGIFEARGTLIARMDGDDISYLQRFERQVDFLNVNPEVDVVGCWLECFGARDEVWKYPTENAEISCRLLFESSIPHATVMIRRKVFFDDNYRYSANYPRAEDYELWTRMIDHYSFANIDEILYRYRQYGLGSDPDNQENKKKSADRIRALNLMKLECVISEKELELHNQLASHKYGASLGFLTAAEKWLLKIEHANEKSGVFDAVYLKKVLAEKWWDICNRSQVLGLSGWRVFSNSPLSYGAQLSRLDFAKFWLKCVLAGGGKDAQ